AISCAVRVKAEVACPQPPDLVFVVVNGAPGKAQAAQELETRIASVVEMQNVQSRNVTERANRTYLDNDRAAFVVGDRQARFEDDVRPRLRRELLLVR